MKNFNNLKKNKTIYFIILVLALVILVYLTQPKNKIVTKQPPEISVEKLEDIPNQGAKEFQNKEIPLTQSNDLNKEKKTKQLKASTKKKSDGNVQKKIEKKIDKKIIEKSTAKENDTALNTVRKLHEGLKEIKSKDYKNYNEIISLVQNTYDTEQMLLKVIGNVWRSSPENKKRIMIDVFEEYITKNYIKRFAKIDETKFEILEEKKISNFIMVKSKLVLKQEDISINYLLNKKNGNWKIFDILLAGSVSEIATKKSEFNRFIKDGDINPLIDALKEKNKVILN